MMPCWRRRRACSAYTVLLGGGLLWLAQANFVRVSAIVLRDPRARAAQGINHV